MKYILVILFLVFAESITAQNQNPKAVADTPMPITSWHSYPVPASLSTAQYLSDSAWTVYFKNGGIYTKKSQRTATARALPFKQPAKDSLENLPGKLSIIQVQGGFLVGIHRDHADGGLYWMSADRGKRNLISAGNVAQVKRIGSKVYILQSASGTDSAGGYLKEVVYKNGKMQVEVLSTLPGHPFCMDIDEKGNFIVFASGGLFRVAPGQPAEILTPLPGDALSPTSLIIKNDIVNVGVRIGILKYNLQTNQQGLLMPD